MTTKGALALAIALGWAGTALAQAQQQPQQPQQPPQPQNAEEAMQGGGMTDEASLADATARGHFRIGTQRYEEGNFSEAAREFEEAYRLSNRVALMFNAYVAYRDANDTANAARCLRVYLENAGEEVEDRVSLEARLNAMEGGLEEQRAREAELSRREAEAAEAARRAAEQPARQPETWPWIVLGIGGAAVIAGVVTGTLGLMEADALAVDCPGGVCDVSTDLDGRRNNIQTLGIATDVLLFGGGAIALTGLILGLALGIGGGSPAASQSPEVAALCGPTGCAASLRMRF